MKLIINKRNIVMHLIYKYTWIYTHNNNRKDIRIKI